ncbi:MAG: hypothetical protein JW772_02685 [Candidatus Diapherotrites archaeon]|nr:hypothetical protein [Candidatus Diapherotrites archaeon]
MMPRRRKPRKIRAAEVSQKILVRLSSLHQRLSTVEKELDLVSNQLAFQALSDSRRQKLEAMQAGLVSKHNALEARHRLLASRFESAKKKMG